MLRHLRPQIHVWRPPDIAGVELQWCHDVQAAVPTHFHDGYQLGLLLFGALDIDIAGHVAHAEAGDLVLLDARQPHAMSGSTEQPVSAVVIEISEARMRHCLELSAEAASPCFDHVVVHDDDAADALRDMHQRLAHDEQHERTSALADLEPLVCHFVAEHGTLQPDELDDLRAEAVEQVRRHLDTHLTERLAIDDLARSIGASKFQLIRCFKQRFGLPPLAYQMQRRINRAKELLAAGQAISDVAFNLGFADQSHLNRHFRRLTLITPGDYQRDQRGDPQPRKDAVGP